MITTINEFRKFNENNSNTITMNSVIQKEWIKEIISYQEGLDSNARSEYIHVMKNAAGKTIKQMASEMFKKIYPGQFPDKEIENAYFEDFTDQMQRNLVAHLNNKFGGIKENNSGKEDVKFNYMMLNRLQMDCDYFLGNGKGSERNLHQGSVDKQIAEMKRIWNALEEKPEWLTMEQIDDYENKMKNYTL